MNVLILSCNTGQGHNSVADAIAEVVEDRGHQCEVVDALRFISDRTSKIMSWGHSFIYCHCPKVFTVGYSVAEKHPKSLDEGSPAYWLFARGSEDLYAYCKEQNYDAIICAHVFSALMLTDVRNNYDYNVPGYFVATDYTSYPGVQWSVLDSYFIPDENLSGDYEGKSTVVTGIPVQQRFFKEMDRAAIRQSLGIPEDKQYVLMMCGSMGCGPMTDVTKRIVSGMDENTVLSIVCGTNQRLYNRLSSAYEDNPQVIVHGYVQNIPQMMAAADICVTKPGGISTSEAMTMGLPMVLVDAVAGCEDYNMHYFQDLDGAVAAKNPKEIAELCLELLADKDRLAKMRRNLLAHRKNGAAIICDYLLEQMK